MNISKHYNIFVINTTEIESCLNIFFWAINSIKNCERFFLTFCLNLSIFFLQYFFLLIIVVNLISNFFMVKKQKVCRNKNN